ncbi:hypothetical protein Tco_0814564 [Tanacetum coccineum]
MGTPTQVCVWSCPNFSAPAGRPFSFWVYGPTYELTNIIVDVFEYHFQRHLLEQAFLKIEYKRSCITTPDGGVSSLGWPPQLDEDLTNQHDTTILIDPGNECLNRGCFPIVINPRGATHSPLTTPCLYMDEDTDDIKTAVYQYPLSDRTRLNVLVEGWEKQGISIRVLPVGLPESGPARFHWLGVVLHYPIGVVRKIGSAPGLVMEWGSPSGGSSRDECHFEIITQQFCKPFVLLGGLNGLGKKVLQAMMIRKDPEVATKKRYQEQSKVMSTASKIGRARSRSGSMGVLQGNRDSMVVRARGWEAMWWIKKCFVLVEQGTDCGVVVLYGIGGVELGVTLIKLVGPCNNHVEPLTVKVIWNVEVCHNGNWPLPTITGKGVMGAGLEARHIVNSLADLGQL